MFVKAPEPETFKNEVYKSRLVEESTGHIPVVMLIENRVKDWLYGLRAAQPDRETHEALNAEPPTESERFRIVHHLITSPTNEGGAGITPNTSEWKSVESIFPLHDHAFNRHWISKWSKETFLKIDDLDEIRDRLGEKVSVLHRPNSWRCVDLC